MHIWSKQTLDVTRLLVFLLILSSVYIAQSAVPKVGTLGTTKSEFVATESVSSFQEYSEKVLSDYPISGTPDLHKQDLDFYASLIDDYLLNPSMEVPIWYIQQLQRGVYTGLIPQSKIDTLLSRQDVKDNLSSYQEMLNSNSQVGVALGTSSSLSSSFSYSFIGMSKQVEANREPVRRGTYFVHGELGRIAVVITEPGVGPADDISVRLEIQDPSGSVVMSTDMTPRTQFTNARPGSGFYFGYFTVDDRFQLGGQHTPIIFAKRASDLTFQQVNPEFQPIFYVNALHPEVSSSAVQYASGTSSITVSGKIYYVFTILDPRVTPPSPEVAQREILAADGANFVAPSVTAQLLSSNGNVVSSSTTNSYDAVRGYSLTLSVPSDGRYTVSVTADKTNTPANSFNGRWYGSNSEFHISIGTTRPKYEAGDIRTFLVLPVFPYPGFVPSEVPFIATAVGKNVVVWVELDAANKKASELVPVETSTRFRQQFDDNIWFKEVYGNYTSSNGRILFGEYTAGTFGVPEDVDNEPQIHMLVYRIETVFLSDPTSGVFVAGFYSGLFSDLNGKDVINIASVHDVAQHGLSTIAHEFQHQIHARMDPAESTWLNEGMSGIAERVVFGVGAKSGHIFAFLQTPVYSLTSWDNPQILADYGKAFLFLQYLSDHFDGRRSGLFPGTDTNPDRIHTLIVADAAQSGDSITSSLQRASYLSDFRTVEVNWRLANYVDDPAFPTPSEEVSGAYGYPSLKLRSFGGVSLQASHNTYPVTSTGADEAWGVSYVNFQAGLNTGTLNVDFSEAAQYIVQPHSGRKMWYSGQADIPSNHLLTNTFSLIDTVAPVFTFFANYNTEDTFDYLYVEASTDGGTTFDTLFLTTGQSGDWIPITISLAQYAGEIIVLRFRYEQDLGNLISDFFGVFVDDIEIRDGTSVIFHDDAETPDDWQTPGGTSPDPTRITLPWTHYPVAIRLTSLNLVQLQGDTRQAVLKLGEASEFNVDAFGTDHTAAVMIVTTYTEPADFDYGARILETTPPHAQIARQAAISFEGGTAPIIANTVVAGQRVKIDLTLSVTDSPAFSVSLKESAPSIWNPVPSQGSADSVSTSAFAGTTTITWTFSRIPAGGVQSVSYTATAPNAPGPYNFGPAEASYSDSLGRPYQSTEASTFTLNVISTATFIGQRYQFDTQGTAYTIPTKSPTHTANADFTVKVVANDGTFLYFQVEGGTLTIGSQTYTIGKGTGTYNQLTGEISFHMDTSAGKKLVLKGTATITDLGGTVTFLASQSKLASKYFLHLEGTLSRALI